MLRHCLIALAAGALVAGCVETRPEGPDRDTPNITLTLLDGTGTPDFSTDEGDTAPADACGTARAFPATVSVAVGDSGGVGFVNIRVFPSELIPGSITVGPDAPAATFEVTRDGAADVLRITVASPGEDLVRTGVLANFDVRGNPPVAIVVDAIDTSGNIANLYQVDIRDLQDPVICRNDPS